MMSSTCECVRVFKVYKYLFCHGFGAAYLEFDDLSESQTLISLQITMEIVSAKFAFALLFIPLQPTLIK